MQFWWFRLTDQSHKSIRHKSCWQFQPYSTHSLWSFNILNVLYAEMFCFGKKMELQIYFRSLDRWASIIFYDSRERRLKSIKLKTVLKGLIIVEKWRLEFDPMFDISGTFLSFVDPRLMMPIQYTTSKIYWGIHQISVYVIGRAYLIYYTYSI